jgi:transposase-like protein
VTVPVIETLLREGAQKMLKLAIEAEVAEYIERHAHLRDEEKGHRLVVRNGYMPERHIQSPLGPIQVRQPRVEDRRAGCRYTSNILPKYLKRTPSLDNLIPTLYLKGVSTNGMVEALAAILGPQAEGLSPASVVRLCEQWQQEMATWQERDLKKKRYVYWWADGIYFNVRLSEERPCLLVIVGALEDGRKEIVAFADGERESALSWKDMLLDLKRRGLEEAPQLAVADGALGFWKAIEEVFPSTREQRCWVHKIANILDKLPKSLQAQAKTLLHEMYLSPTRHQAHRAYKDFLAIYGAKYPKACECLRKDEEVLFAFYDFPAEHWAHLRTTNPIESTFATVRHRQRQTKGNGSRMATLAMAFQLLRECEKTWRKLNGTAHIAKVISGVKFEDGVEVMAA